MKTLVLTTAILCFATGSYRAAAGEATKVVDKGFVVDTPDLGFVSVFEDKGFAVGPLDVDVKPKHKPEPAPLPVARMDMDIF